MGFAWIFAIISGVIILFIALFATTNIIDTSQKEINTKTAVAFANVLDSFQTTVQEASGDSLQLPLESRINIDCNLEGDFGNSLISFEDKSGFGNEWSKKGGEISTKNAYLFSEKNIQGKTIYFLSFPLKIPFKTGDLVIVYSDVYCFIDPPTEIEDSLSSLENSQNFVITSSKSSCPDNSKKVCFSGNCDIEVKCTEANCKTGYVNDIYFSENFFYGAVFSSEENYKCNVGRLIKRLSYLSDIYERKAQFIASRGCDTGLKEEISLLKNAANEYKDLRDLPAIQLISENIKEKNDDLNCELF